MQMLLGAIIFAVGCFFGAVFYVAAQKMEPARKDLIIKQKLQDAILKAFDKQDK